jgi:glycerophosphoryl diester phosphodiesterase
MKTGKWFLGWVLLTATVGCEQTYEAPVPSGNWEVFQSPQAVGLTAGERAQTEGVYTLSKGAAAFGDQVVLKWTYRAQGADTTHYLSILCGKDVTHMILEGRRVGANFYFQGYWRKLINTETGLVRLTASPGNAPTGWQMEGVFGNQSALPQTELVFTYQRPINKQPFEILAHRAGGRTSDLLPASENSLDMIRLTSRLGATGIEIDVRLTKDGIPVLYHDNTLNLRLIQKNGLVGRIEDYTYEQLYSYVRLIHGERIPTLAEALETVLNETPLTFVWLDTKYEGSLTIVRDIQKEFIQRAAAAGRQLDIVIGLPGAKPVEMFLALPDYASAPALCELDLETVRQTQAQIWAPRWTQGTQDSEVALMKSEGRRVFVWTLDVPEYVRQYTITENFDGILSNYPSIVAYYHYTRP